MRHNGKSFPPLPLLTLGSNTFCRVSKHPSLLRLSQFSIQSPFYIPRNPSALGEPGWLVTLVLDHHGMPGLCDFQGWMHERAFTILPWHLFPFADGETKA